MPPNHYLARRDRLPVPQSPGLERRRRPSARPWSAAHDRPRGGAGSAAALRGAGRLQMVRRRPAGRFARVRRRGKRGRVVPAARRQRLDDRQGRHRAGAAVGRDHRAHRPRSRRALSRAHARPRRAGADRVDAPATAEQKQQLAKLSPQQLRSRELAGEPIQSVLDAARRATTRRSAASRSSPTSGWFAARPSGTEDIYKIYAESFRGGDHLKTLLGEAQAIVDKALAS